MAKVTKSMTFKNATICLEDMTITEYEKDDVREYSIIDALRDWDMIDGLDISFRRGSDFARERSDN